MRKPNWVFLNGGVAIGEDSHSKLFRDLADRFDLDGHLKGKIRATWVSNLQLEPGLPIDIARGHMEPTGHANIWESNVDRNHVRDAVESAHGKLRTASDEWTVEGYSGRERRLQENAVIREQIQTAINARDFPRAHQLIRSLRQQQADAWKPFVPDTNL